MEHFCFRTSFSLLQWTIILFWPARRHALPAPVLPMIRYLAFRFFLFWNNGIFRPISLGRFCICFYASDVPLLNSQFFCLRKLCSNSFPCFDWLRGDTEETYSSVWKWSVTVKVTIIGFSLFCLDDDLWRLVSFSLPQLLPMHILWHPSFGSPGPL